MARDTPPAASLLPLRYSQEHVEWLKCALDKKTTSLTRAAWHMEKLSTDDVPVLSGVQKSERKTMTTVQLGVQTGWYWPKVLQMNEIEVILSFVQSISKWNHVAVQNSSLIALPMRAVPHKHNAPFKVIKVLHCVINDVTTGPPCVKHLFQSNQKRLQLGAILRIRYSNKLSSRSILSVLQRNHHP